MGWKETCAVQEREKFCRAVLAGELSFSELCRRFGVSRPTGYKWLERYEDCGLSGLEDQSRARHGHANEICQQMVDQVVSVRERYPSWGPKKIVGWLHERGVADLPAASTVGEILKRHGLVVSRKRVRRASPSAALSPFSSIVDPNQVWCADYKGWFKTGDGQRCDPLTISDAASRYLIRCQATAKTDGEHVRAVFDAAFHEFGLPSAIRTDNGAPFASTGLAGLSRLSVWWLKLGIIVERIEPGKPQQNGRHERMHWTLKRETAMPPKATLRQQQKAFDHFLRYYNDDRPHEALGQHTPASLYSASMRSYHGHAASFDYPEHMQVRQVRLAGEIKWRYRRIGLSQALVGERVGIEEVADGIWVVWAGPMQLGWIDERRLAKASGAYKFASLERGLWK